MEGSGDGSLDRTIRFGLLLVGGPAVARLRQTAESPAPAAVAVHADPPPPGCPTRMLHPTRPSAPFSRRPRPATSRCSKLCSRPSPGRKLPKTTSPSKSIRTRTTKFEVGKFEYVTPEKDGAHVACVWIDRDEKGTEYKHDVIWVLRKEDGGWRIVGMITRPFPDKDPVVFNYEDIPSLVQAKNFIQTESERREAEAQRQQAEPKKPDGEHAATKALTANSSDQPKDGVQREAMKPQPGTVTPK